MNVAIITQARMGSSRLPNKLLMELDNGVQLLDLHLRRIMQVRHANQICVATTFEDGVDAILNIAKNLEVSAFQGSASDVLDRFYRATHALDLRPDYIVRLTADCPLIDPALVDLCIDKIAQLKVDYLSNALEPRYPDGQDIEVFTYDALEEAWRKGRSEIEREHVTPYIWLNSDYKGKERFKTFSMKNSQDYSDLRMTVDYEKDFSMLNALINVKGMGCDWEEYAEELLRNEEIKNINSEFERNEGRVPSKY